LLFGPRRSNKPLQNAHNLPGFRRWILECHEIGISQIETDLAISVGKIGHHLTFKDPESFAK
jgi:hypothetical protein